ncbi:MAG: methyltransferase domain-containing protein [Clostridiaceae bacterium]|nr:methyltransferase domain-containing protein [Clostridiaceae bacterium]
MAQPKAKRGPDQARLAAVKVIRQVTGEKAFSNESAAWHLSAPELDERDRAFASALIFGTLSQLPLIDTDLARISSRPLDRLDPWVLAILRMGVWQLYFSYQATAAAACDESVRLARFLAGEKVTGFVNGILRNLARKRPLHEGEEKDYLEAGLTAELYGLFKSWYGRETALALGHASLEAPDYLAIRPNACRLDAFKAWLQSEEAARFQAQRLSWPPGAYSLKPAGHSVTGTQGYLEGLYTVQSQAAMAAGLLAGVNPKDRILDLCAAPGGKTGHLAELLGCQGQLTAFDLSAERVALLEATLERLGHDFVDSRPQDATRLGPELSGAFDLVVCDVPCSGLGLLQKRPEIRSRVTRASIDRLKTLQQSILTKAARTLAPEGRLLYTSCTVNPEENEEQVKIFLASEEGRGFQLDSLEDELRQVIGEAVELPLSARLPGTVLFLPHRDGTDGFYIARIRRRPL